jgi:hypothetical protein
MTPFYVINYDFNREKMEQYDVMPYLIDSYKKSKKKYDTVDEFKEFIKIQSMYQFWSRCEYEIILSDWPNQSHHEKWDVHKQIMMNLGIITNIFIENIKSSK